MVFILYKLYILYPYTNPSPKPTHHRKHSAFLHLKIIIIIILCDLLACLPMVTSLKVPTVTRVPMSQCAFRFKSPPG